MPIPTTYGYCPKNGGLSLKRGLPSQLSLAGKMMGVHQTAMYIPQPARRQTLRLGET
jgi:hypothetical protein